jgi:hypothetical protein
MANNRWQAAARAAKVEKLVPALRVHLEALGVELTADLVEQTLANLAPAVWAGAALIVGCRPPSVDTIAAVTAQLVSEYTIDDRPTLIDLSEVDHLFGGSTWH